MKDKRYGWGLFATGVYFCAIAVYVVSSWSEVAALKPNELGDALAGAASPLAFLWLVLGYLQQGDELKQNTAALQLQADELKLSVEQQAQLVAVSREQIEDQRARHRAETLPHFTVEKRVVAMYLSQRDFSLDFRNIGADCSGLEAIVHWNEHPYRQSLEKMPHMTSWQLDVGSTSRLDATMAVLVELQFVTLAGGKMKTTVTLQFTKRDGEPLEMDIADGPTPFERVLS